jgi:hypothetical protein
MNQTLYQYKLNLVRFEVLTEETVFWDVILSSIIDIYLCFEGTYCLHLHGLREIWRRTPNSKLSLSLLLLDDLTACLIFHP